MRYLYYVMLGPFVWIQVVGGFLVVISILHLSIKQSFRKRFLWYLYEIPLLILHIHFLLSGLMEPSDSLQALLYWSSQISFIGFVFLPLILEWKVLAPLFRKKGSPEPSKGKRVLYLSVATILVLVAFGYVLKMEAMRLALSREITESTKRISVPIHERLP